MRYRYLFSLVLMFCVIAGHAQKRKVVSGLITDAGSGEVLIGAAAVSGTAGAVSNSFGFYSLTLPADAKTVAFSYVGYETLTVVLSPADTVINAALVPGTSILESVVTAPKETGIESARMSSLEMPVEIIKGLPSILGEADVLKSLQYLPGVQAGVEGLSGLYVRGGGPDENLIMLDGIPVYCAEHLLGIFSTFQADAVKKVTMYKGAFPASYGGRVSSIVDVRTKDGNMYKSNSTVGISMLCDQVHVEGPISRGRTSYSFSARGMHSIFVEPVLRIAGVDINYYFYDVDAKFTHRFSDRDRLYLNLYTGADDFHFNATDDFSKDIYQNPENLIEKRRMGASWGNNVAALRWNHVLSGNMFSNTTVAYSGYRMKMGTDMRSDQTFEDASTFMDRYIFNYRSGMRDIVARTDFDYVPAPAHKIRFGADYVFHIFRPETENRHTEDYGDGPEDVAGLRSGSRQNGHEAGLYLEDEMNFGRFTLTPGVRMSLFNTQGKSYWTAEPRFGAKWDVAGGFSVKAAYSRMSQFIHLLASSMTTLPTDLWVPITKDIKPETADQYSAGFYYNGLPGWEFSVEAYYKDLRNVLEYQEGVSFMLDAEDWDSKVETGTGRSAGLEFFIEKTSGKTTGWLAYTLAKSDRLFPAINRGERFPYKYDRRHNVSLVVNHKFNEKYDISATWSFASGSTTTLPERHVAMTTPGGDSYYADYVSSRNNYRLPATHSLNIGFNIHTKHRKHDGVWNISIYNLYNNMNPTLMYKEYERSYLPEEGIHVEKPVLKKVTLLPFFPSVGYTFKF